MKRTPLIVLLVAVGMQFFTSTLAQQPEPTQVRGGGPNGFNYKVYPGEFSKVALAVARRVSEMNFDTQSGFKSFTIKGAFVYGNEFDYIKPADLMASNRRSGMVLLPYDYSRSFSSDGQQRVSATLFGFRNMNEYSMEKNTFFDPDSFFSVVNTMDIGTVTYDDNYTYSNLRTFDIKFITIEPRVGVIYSDEQKYYLTLKAAGDIGIGIGIGSFQHADGSRVWMAGGQIYNNGDYPIGGVPYRHSLGFRGQYSAGLEYNKKTKNGGEFNFQTQWKHGVQRITLNDRDRIDDNFKRKQQYDDDLIYYQQNYTQIKAQYDAEVQTFNVRKGKFYNTNHPYKYSDSIYIAESGDVMPKMPTPEAPKYQLNFVRAPRLYKVLNTSFSYSQVINQKQMSASKRAVAPDIQMKKRAPVRLGFEIEWNLLIHDEFKNVNDGSKYDFQFKDNFNRQWVGRLVLKF